MMETDIVVVGAGNAALCAALSAREAGANVLVLEKAPKEERGGNSRYTYGAMRFVYNGVSDLKEVIPELTDEEIAESDYGTYTKEQFFQDMKRVTENRSDPELLEILVNNSLDTMAWMRENNVPFTPIYGRQAFKVDGKYKFWGGLTVEAKGGGEAMIQGLIGQAEHKGVDILYSAEAYELIRDDDGVKGIRIRKDGKSIEIAAKAVILACGGFEANSEMRTKYLGPGWDLAKVRGTEYNTGDGIRMALDIGATSYGQWSGCHAVGWDKNAPGFGDLAIGHGFQKHSYPFGIMVNLHGQRFVDEGADFRNYTYAKYGREILSQPGQVAWQIFDKKVLHLLNEEEYLRDHATKVTAETLEELAEKLAQEGVDKTSFLKTIQDYNKSVDETISFNPNVKDGRRTKDDLRLPKTNWANTIEEGPFEAYGITCGITFTFGGLRINNKGEVQDLSNQTIPGLYAAGELVGGLFYFNYPGGSGLTAGSVFGRISGKSAGKYASLEAVK
nr:FAD-dependent tricarballylate dehydrogenase TcuA [Scopulibacillus darangshiensis]